MREYGAVKAELMIREYELARGREPRLARNIACGDVLTAFPPSQLAGAVDMMISAGLLTQPKGIALHNISSTRNRGHRVHIFEDGTVGGCAELD